MHDVKKIDVMEGILDENDDIAAKVRDHMSSKGVLVVNEMGAPGVGKTTTLKNIFSRIEGVKPYVIEGDIEADFDTKTLQDLGDTELNVCIDSDDYMPDDAVEHIINTWNMCKDDKEIAGIAGLDVYENSKEVIGTKFPEGLKIGRAHV